MGKTFKDIINEMISKRDPESGYTSPHKREQILMQMGIYWSEHGVSTKDYSFHANPKTIKKYSLEDVAGVTPDDFIKEGFIILFCDKTGEDNECAD